MESKHISGPWIVSNYTAKKGKYKAFELDIDQKDDCIVSLATIWCRSENPSKEEIDTAKLIASAPNLLAENAALKKALKDAIIKMDRARSILHKPVTSEWNMLNTEKLKQVLNTNL